MRIMGFPGLYIQGEGVLEQLGDHIARFGKKPFIISDSRVWELYGSLVSKSLSSFMFSPFGGELTLEEIEHQHDRAKASGCDFAIGLGGGKVQDAAKAIKLHLNIPVVIAPTVASNDAATSRLIITYTEEGKFLGPLFLPTNPDAVIVDTKVIRKAPLRFLKAGIADALATFYEAEECYKSGALNFFGGRQTLTALRLAKLCQETVFRTAKKALQDIQSGIPSEEVEQLVEAVVLLSGLGFEGCGVAAAHAVSQGFTLIPELRGNLHGEEVAVGLIVQVLLEKRPAYELNELLNLYRDLRLPISLKELGLPQPTVDQLKTIAQFACRKNSRLYNMAFPITEEDIVRCLQKGLALAESTAYEVT